eukprot:906815-Rhodomonas_salina.1
MSIAIQKRVCRSVTSRSQYWGRAKAVAQYAEASTGRYAQDERREIKGVLRTRRTRSTENRIDFAGGDRPVRYSCTLSKGRITCRGHSSRDLPYR